MRRGIVLMYAVLLTACGSSEPGKIVSAIKSLESDSKNQLNTEVNRRCRALGTGAATVTFTAGALCQNCTVSDGKNAIDGTDETVATLNSPSGSPGTMTFRATAQPGVVFPAGSNAAVTLSAHRSEVSIGGNLIRSANDTQNWQMTARTFLDGVKQEEESFPVSLNNGDNSRNISGIATTKPYNALEVAFDRSGIYVSPTVQGTQLSPSPTDYLRPSNVEVHEFCGDFDLSGLKTSKSGQAIQSVELR